MRNWHWFGVTVYVGGATMTAQADTVGSLGYAYQHQDLELEGGGRLKADLQGVTVDVFEQEQNANLYGDLSGRFLVGDADVSAALGEASRERLWAAEYRIGARLTPMLGLYTGIGYQDWRSQLKTAGDDAQITRQQWYSPLGLDLLGTLGAAGWRLFAEYGMQWRGRNEVEQAGITTRPDQNGGHYYQLGAQFRYRLAAQAQLEMGPYYRRWRVDAADHDAVPAYRASSYGLSVALAF